MCLRKCVSEEIKIWENMLNYLQLLLFEREVGLRRDMKRGF